MRRTYNSRIRDVSHEETSPKQEQPRPQSGADSFYPALHLGKGGEYWCIVHVPSRNEVARCDSEWQCRRMCRLLNREKIGDGDWSDLPD